jgi:hypothetical protein
MTLTLRSPIQMELEEAQYSDDLKKIEGTVQFDLLKRYKKGDKFQAFFTDKKEGHGFILFQTSQRVVLIHISNTPRK